MPKLLAVASKMVMNYETFVRRRNLSEVGLPYTALSVYMTCVVAIAVTANTHIL